jgi:anaerobic magnesium-protoporphyrin IX monomethyl ester cyclase
MKLSVKVLLISPPSSCVDNDRVEPPLGLLYIASELLENGYQDVVVYDLSGCKDDEQIADMIMSVPQANIYGISCLCTNYHYAKKIVESIRLLNPLAYVVMGGPNPSATPDFTLNDSGADAVIVGEGEDAFADCVDQYDSGSPAIGIVPGRARANIDSYPFPARNLVDMTTYSRRLMGQPVVSLLSSRGCKYRCIHCNSVVMGGRARNARYRSAGNILEEIVSLRDQFSYFRFNDDHFTGNPNLKELLNNMRDLYLLKFSG